VCSTVTPLGIALLDGHDSGTRPRPAATARLTALPPRGAVSA
jgi:hypothetical protein